MSHLRGKKERSIDLDVAASSPHRAIADISIASTRSLLLVHGTTVVRSRARARDLGSQISEGPPATARTAGGILPCVCVCRRLTACAYAGMNVLLVGTTLALALLNNSTGGGEGPKSGGHKKKW